MHTQALPSPNNSCHLKKQMNLIGEKKKQGVRIKEENHWDLTPATSGVHSVLLHPIPVWDREPFMVLVLLRARYLHQTS